MEKENSKKAISRKVVATNIQCIKTLLESALLATVEADQAMDKNEQNMAIGYLMDLELALQSVKALYGATLCIHHGK